MVIVALASGGVRRRLAMMRGASGQGLGGGFAQGTPEECAEQGAQGAPAGASPGQGTGERIEAISVHGWHPFRPKAAVEARRQEGAQSPTSRVVLLEPNIHPSRSQAYDSCPQDAHYQSARPFVLRFF